MWTFVLILGLLGCGAEEPGDSESVLKLRLQVSELEAKVAELEARMDAAAAAAPPVEPVVEALFAPETFEWIKQSGSNPVIVRSLLDPGAVMGTFRVVPHLDPDNKADGIRIAGIRRGSAMYQLGLMNGDIIRAVNGMPLTSMDKAMEVGAALGDAKTLEVTLTRRGEDKVLVIGLE
jgi:membrane-associated protease RseP (regulator of RpoE activity)